MGFDISIAPHENIRSLCWSIMRQGFTESQAANLVAHMMGLSQNEKDWTIKELQYLDFTNKKPL
jgi:hypothetical protein